MTILEALRWGEDKLKNTEEEKTLASHNPKLDAQVLLSYCLEKPTTYLFAHFEDALTEEALEKYHRVIDRRARHEPVAYIIGTKPFYKRPFFVNASVLIPRPETETLVELAMEKINEQSTVIDVGTGSGAIAVTIAGETGQQVVAIDIDQHSLAVAKHNATSHNVDHLISFLHGHLLEPYMQKNIRESNGRHALIVANLPYVPLPQWESLNPDVKKYEPKLAVVGGVDGLELYDALLAQLHQHRHSFPPNTEVLGEMDPSHELMLPCLIKEYFPEADVNVLKDLSDRPRFVSANI